MVPLVLVLPSFNHNLPCNKFILNFEIDLKISSMHIKKGYCTTVIYSFIHHLTSSFDHHILRLENYLIPQYLQIICCIDT